jgi:hypothetical protein
MMHELEAIRFPLHGSRLIEARNVSMTLRHRAS